MLLSNLATLLQIFSSLALALPPRLTELSLAQNEVALMYIKPGLISVLEFPSSITEVRVGNPQDLKAVLSQASTRELTLYFNKKSTQSSNLIVRAQKRLFVFDIVPSQTLHQDYIKIKTSFSLSPTSKTKTIRVSP